MNKLRNPASVAAPLGPYSHGVEIPPNARWLYIAGQVAMKPDASIPDGIESQTELVWQNITAILADAGMKITDLVKINTYVTGAGLFQGMAKVRARILGDHRPASTAVIVTALANPAFLVEVEGVAARTAAMRAEKPEAVSAAKVAARKLAAKRAAGRARKKR